ncbi:MAG: alkaline phosphatase [bacterium]
MKKIYLVLGLILACSLYAQNVEKLRTDYNGPKVKYIFFFIGDGMGLAHINMAEAYEAAVKGKIGVEKLNFTKFPGLAIATNYATDRYITDSAAAGTALATGSKTSVDTISMDAGRTKKIKSIAEMAKEKGMKVGIITTANINDATPAVFYSHQPERSMLKEIANDLPKSGFNFFGGGNLKNVKNAKELLTKNGYVYVDSKKGFNSLKDKNAKVFATCPIRDASEACRFTIDQTSADITLSDITKKGIELLDNPKGFFVMIEGGKIDWAAHVNDAASDIKDVEAFDKAIAEALKFYEKHPEETLIVVTADHETGGLSLGYAGMHYDTAFAKLKNQKISVDVMEQKIAEYKKSHTAGKAKLKDLMPFIEQKFGLGSKSKGLALTEDDKKALEEAFTATITGTKNISKYGKDAEPLSWTISKILDQKSGISWTTFSHTGIPVIVFSKGHGSELFKGYIDNTDIPKNIMIAAGLK